MGVERDDATLIDACLQGRHEAWNELVERYGRLVYSIPRRYGMSDPDCDDVFQNVFSILLQRLGSIKDRSRLSAWLITTTHRECWRLGRRSSAFTSEDVDRYFSDVSAPPEEAMIRWEQQHAVRRALETLGGRCEQLLTALFLSSGDPSYERIAEDLGLKVGSIGPTRARCFRKLERILGEFGLGDPAEEPRSGPREP
jgi:RNA polymerase sigma factor (sigma-70 family)